jgi:hypothetical protein
MDTLIHTHYIAFMMRSKLADHSYLSVTHQYTHKHTHTKYTLYFTFMMRSKLADHPYLPVTMMQGELVRRVEMATCECICMCVCVCVYVCVCVCGHKMIRIEEISIDSLSHTHTHAYLVDSQQFGQILDQGRELGSQPSLEVFVLLASHHVLLCV